MKIRKTKKGTEIVRNLTFLSMDGWLRAAGNENRGITFTTDAQGNVLCLLVERKGMDLAGMKEGKHHTPEQAFSHAYRQWRASVPYDKDNSQLPEKETGNEEQADRSTSAGDTPEVQEEGSAA